MKRFFTVLAMAVMCMGVQAQGTAEARKAFVDSLMTARMLVQLDDNKIQALQQKHPGYKDMQLVAAYAKAQQQVLAPFVEQMLGSATDELMQLPKEKLEMVYMSRLQSPLAQLEIVSMTLPIVAQMVAQGTGEKDPLLEAALQVDMTPKSPEYKAVLDKIFASTPQMADMLAGLCSQQTGADAAQAQGFLQGLMEMTKQTMAVELMRFYTLEELQEMARLCEMLCNEAFFQQMTESLASVAAKAADIDALMAENLKTQTPLEVAQYAEKMGRSTVPFVSPVQQKGRIPWDGGLYDGELLGGRPHGIGTQTSPKGEQWMGFWYHGLRHGLIVHTKKGKKTNEGWQYGVQQKNATFLPQEDYTGTVLYQTKNFMGMEETYGISSQMVYNGLVSTGTASAEGTTLKGTFYCDKLVSGVMQQSGQTQTVGTQPVIVKNGATTVCVYGDADEMIGYMEASENGRLVKQGYCNGKEYFNGVVVFEGDVIYRGEMVNDEFEGEGELQQKDVWMKGTWRAGTLHGKQCVVTYSKKGDNYYEGGMANGEYDGEGVRKFADGTQMKGNWKNGQLNGQAVVIYPGGNSINGTFKDGMAVSGKAYTGGRAFSIKEAIDCRLQ